MRILRILVCRTELLQDGSSPDVEQLLSAGAHSLLVNLYGHRDSDARQLRKRHHNDERVSFAAFDPADPPSLLNAFTDGGIGYDAIICPAGTYGLTQAVLAAMADAGSFRHRLRTIGCPQASTAHLSEALDLAPPLGVAVVNTPAVHARAVAEYTIWQFGLHARRLPFFHAETGCDSQSWPHDEAFGSTHTLSGQTLGVIGGSGADGAAVIALGLKVGLRVLAVNSGRFAGRERIRALGAEVCANLDDLLARSDFISVNCRMSEATRGMIGKSQIERMKLGVIVVNPAGAEVIDKQAVLDDFTGSRRMAALVLDMPYGGRRDAGAFGADPDNAILRRAGVLFTPRVAGYTVESRHQAALELANAIVSTASGPSDGLAQLLDDAILLAAEAGAKASDLREAGLTVVYKDDGSPTTNADVAAESIIRSGLRDRGHTFWFSGEEIQEPSQRESDCELVIDGIDGTRNFRDGNYGWCVSIAAVVAGETVLAVVHDPRCGETFYARKSVGAFVRTGHGHDLARGDTPRRCKVPPECPADFSFSVGSFRVHGSSLAKSEIIEDLKRLGGRGRDWGSVALSICAAARGGLGAYIQSRSHRHDHAAALLIAREAGATVYERPTAVPHVTDVIVAHPSLASRVIQIFEQRAR